MAQAEEWLRKGVKYNFYAMDQGYRTQCSGLIAMAWGLPTKMPRSVSNYSGNLGGHTLRWLANQATPRCPDLEKKHLAREITKDELLAGDAMVCSMYTGPLPEGAQAGGHCLLFER